MLYSHIRFMIADVEMPVSGPIYVSGGMLQTRLSFILSEDDKSLYYASPLARIKYERVPVKLLGSKPQASVADDENGGIGNYIVIFEGAADMQISFSQSTRQLDIAIQAVPLSVKALDSIIYSMLSIGSVTSNVNQAERTAYEKRISEGNAEKVVVTAGGGSPHSANSILFLKKLVTGGSPADILRPTDMIEYAINNILGYAGSNVLSEEKIVPFVSPDENFKWLDGGNGAGSLPDYILNTMIGEPEATAEDGSVLFKEGSPGIQYGVLADEFLCRSVMVQQSMSTASSQSKYAGASEAPALTDAASNEVTDDVVQYLKRDKYWFPATGVTLNGIQTSVSELIKTSKTSVAELKTSDSDKLPSCLKTVIERRVLACNDLTGQVLRTIPEAFGLLNGMMKCFLSVFRFFVFTDNKKADSWTLFDLVYTNVNVISKTNPEAGSFADALQQLLVSGFNGTNVSGGDLGEIMFDMFQDVISSLFTADGEFSRSLPSVSDWKQYTNSGITAAEADPWILAARDLTAAAVSEALRVLETAVSYLPSQEYLVGPCYLNLFRAPKHNTESDKIIPSLNTIAGWMVTLYDGYRKKGLLETDKNTAEYPEPTRFDIQAVRSIAGSTAYNRVAAPGFLRQPGDNPPKRKFVYPHTAVAAYDEFKQLVSSLAVSDTTMKVSLRSLLAALYDKLNLSLATPLNKPICIQEDKQISCDKVAVDPARSLAEILILPNHELQVIPKCNVFAVDMRYGAQLQYSEQSNLSRLLVRYTPPVDLVGGDASSVPSQVFAFDLTDPRADMRQVSPATLEEYNNARRISRGAASYTAGYTNGALYNLERTEIVDVSHDVAALAQLCRSMTDVGDAVKKPDLTPRNTAAIDAALDVAQSSFPDTITIRAFTPKTIISDPKEEKLSYKLSGNTASYLDVASASKNSKVEAVLNTYSAAAALVVLNSVLTTPELRNLKTTGSAEAAVARWFQNQFTAEHKKEGVTELSDIELSFAAVAGRYATEFMASAYFTKLSASEGELVLQKATLDFESGSTNNGTGWSMIDFSDYSKEAVVSNGFAAFTHWSSSVRKLYDTHKSQVTAFFSSSLWASNLGQKLVKVEGVDVDTNKDWYINNASSLPEPSLASNINGELIALAEAGSEVNLQFLFPTNQNYDDAGSLPSNTLTEVLFPIYTKILNVLRNLSYLSQYKTVVTHLKDKKKTSKQVVTTLPDTGILDDLTASSYTSGDSGQLLTLNCEKTADALERAAKLHNDLVAGDAVSADLLKSSPDLKPTTIKIVQPEAELFLRREEFELQVLVQDFFTGDPSIWPWKASNGQIVQTIPGSIDIPKLPGLTLLLDGAAWLFYAPYDGGSVSGEQGMLSDPWFHSLEKNASGGRLPDTLLPPVFQVTESSSIETDSSKIPWLRLDKEDFYSEANKPTRALVACDSLFKDSETPTMWFTSSHKAIPSNPKLTGANFSHLPVVAWYSGGDKASVLYMDMLTGQYIDFTGRHWFNPELPEEFKSVNLNGESEWCPKTEQWGKLFEFMKKNNPFGMFPGLKNTPDRVVYKVIPAIKGDLTLWEAAFQIPGAVIEYEIKVRETVNPLYTDRWQVIDPRHDLALDISDVLKTFTRDGGEDARTATAKTSGFGGISKLNDTLVSLFGSEDAAKIKIAQTECTNMSDGTDTVGGKTFAVAAPGRLKLNNFEAIRYAGSSRYNQKDFPLRLHLGCDLSSGASLELNWYDNPSIPKFGLSLPWDSYVMYGVQAEDGVLSGYGFFAVVVPADQADSSRLDVALIAHINPAATLLDDISRTFSSGGTAVSDSGNPLGKEQLAALQELVDLSQKCAEYAGQTGTEKGQFYFFNKTKYKTLQSSTDATSKKVVGFAKEYLPKLIKAFGPDGNLRLHRFFLKAGTKIGVMGASGDGSMHYHCEYYKFKRTPLPWAGDDEIKRCKTVNSLAESVFVKNKNDLQEIYNYIIKAHDDAVFYMKTDVAARSWDLVQREAALAVHRMQTNYGLEDFLDGVSGTALAISGSDTFKVPDQELVESVVRMKAYQTILAMYSMAQPAPISLPYYDPYVMDAGMPAAVVYRNDIILTMVSGIQMMVNGPMVNFTVNFTPGISVAKMLPVYLQAMINAGAVKSSLLRRSVFPFHCVEYFNETSFNLNYMAGNYRQMFNKKDFVFDWRDAVVIDLGNNVHKTVNEILPDPAALNHAFNVLSERTPDDKFHIDLRGAKMSDARFPMNEAQMMLKARAWGEDSLYTYTKSCTKYFCQDHRAMMKFSSENSGTYEAEALRNLDAASSKIKTPLDIPRTYYDWHNMFKKLRTSIRSVVNWNDRD